MAVKAGFRRERFTVPNDNMELAARALTNKLDTHQLGELITYLVEYIEDQSNEQ